MDIFVVNFSDADNIKPELLQEFRHKELKNKAKEKEHCFALDHMVQAGLMLQKGTKYYFNTSSTGDYTTSPIVLKIYNSNYFRIQDIFRIKK